MRPGRPAHLWVRVEQTQTRRWDLFLYVDGIAAGVRGVRGSRERAERFAVRWMARHRGRLPEERLERFTLHEPEREASQ